MERPQPFQVAYRIAEVVLSTTHNPKTIGLVSKSQVFGLYVQSGFVSFVALEVTSSGRI
jgi:hypothetical protein